MKIDEVLSSLLLTTNLKFVKDGFNGHAFQKKGVDNLTTQCNGFCRTSFRRANLLEILFSHAEDELKSYIAPLGGQGNVLQLQGP